VLRPQDLLTVARFDYIEGLLGRVRVGKRGMSTRVPILGQDHMSKFGGQSVDRRNDFIALPNRECSAGAEIVLHIDNEQDI
jgi:hypothetical protein